VVVKNFPPTLPCLSGIREPTLVSNRKKGDDTEWEEKN
jgi:hypothetical protein